MKNRRRQSGVWVVLRNRFRLYVVLLMIGGALFNAGFRFWGSWVEFFTVLAAQFLFGQSVGAYLYDKNMIIGPGGGYKEDGAVARNIALFFSASGYLAFFWYGYSSGG